MFNFIKSLFKRVPSVKKLVVGDKVVVDCNPYGVCECVVDRIYYRSHDGHSLKFCRLVFQLNDKEKSINVLYKVCRRVS